MLQKAGYGPSGFRRALGADHAALGPSDIAVHLRRLSPDEPLATLIKLFFLGAHVPVEEAASALDPLELRLLEQANVLRASAFGVGATLEIVPVDDLLIASDPTELVAGRPDYAPGLAGASLTLASVTIRRPVERALDLGTGSGAQALLLALHADTVVATDVNRRALGYAAFNAALNGSSNLILREGSLFDPVEGELFGLVVSNPPYVISPDSDYLFRDSGLAGDSFCEAVVREAPGHLENGGFAQMLGNWVIPTGDHWSDPLRRWVEGSGCDCLVLRQSTWGDLDYATTWNSPLRSDPDAFGAALDRWVEHFRREQITSIAGGLVVLRKRSGANWVLALDAPAARLEPSGDQIERLFDAQDFLRARNDEALLAERLAPAPDLAVDVRLAPERSARLSLARGLALRVDADETTAGLIAGIGGKATLREALAATDSDAEALASVRRLVELGFLVPAG